MYVYVRLQNIAVHIPYLYDIFCFKFSSKTESITNNFAGLLTSRNQNKTRSHIQLLQVICWPCLYFSIKIEILKVQQQLHKIKI